MICKEIPTKSKKVQSLKSNNSIIPVILSSLNSNKSIYPVKHQSLNPNHSIYSVKQNEKESRVKNKD